MRTWSGTALEQHYKFASYVSTLPSHRWAQRALRWKPEGSRSLGRPRARWTDKLQNFCADAGLGDWMEAAQDAKAWAAMADDFVSFSG